MNKWILYSLLFLYCTSFSFGQNESFFVYSLTEGLPQSQVLALTQDSSGYIWVGTNGGGIAKFDGERFEIPSFSEHLISNTILSLYTDKSGQIWIGTDKGLQLVSSGKVKSKFELKTAVRTFYEWNGKMYIGTDQGLYIAEVNNGKYSFNQVNSLKNIPINYIHLVYGQLWVATFNSIWTKQNDSSPFQRLTQLTNGNFIHFQVDDFGFVWISDFNRGVIKYDAISKRTLPINEMDILKKTKNILYIAEENVWFATENQGIVCYNSCTEKSTILQEGNGLPTNRINVLLKDYWGNIWIGTSGGGLVKKTSLPFRHYNLLEYGFGGNRVYAVALDTSGKVLFSSNKNIVGFFGNTDYGKINLDSLQLQSKIRSLALCKNKLWLGTEGGGLIQIDSNRVRQFSKAKGSFEDDIIIQVVADKANRLWIATNSSGVFCLSQINDTLTNIVKIKNLPHNYINALAKDERTRRIWFACRNGNVGYINDDFSVVSFSKENGLPPSAAKCLSIDNEGFCYVGVMGEGVFSNRNSSKGTLFKKVEHANKTYSNNIYSIINTKSGNVWIGTEKGAFHFIIESSTGSCKDILYYGKSEGFLGIENCHNSICIDKKDNVWFGTLNGLTQYNSTYKANNQTPPLLSLQEVYLFNQPIESTKYYSYFNKHSAPQRLLPYFQNQISFQFQAVHLNHSNTIKYRYKLSEESDDWSSWSKENRINFSGLESGNYCFMVQATHDESCISNTEKLYFSINTPFWKKWWFQLLFVVSLIGLVVLFFLIREKRIKRKAEAKTKELKLQNQLLSLEQKALQLQMNPHFIFNALNSIQSLIVVNKADVARQQLQNFAQLMRSLLNNSRKKTISLKEEIEWLTKYFIMEQFCQKTDFTYSIVLNEGMIAEDIEIPSMIIQPYIENAVIHGVAHLEKEGRITVHFSLMNENIMVCEIDDNGVGRTRSNALNVNKKSGHVSLGLEVTSQRLKALSEQNVDCEQIIDKFDEKGKPAGTKVILKIPLHNIN